MFKFVLNVNSEEKEILEKILVENGLDSCITGIKKLKLVKQEDTKSAGHVTSYDKDTSDEGRPPSTPPPPPPQYDNAEDDQCPFWVFLTPCIAYSNRDAHWLGHGNPPAAHNAPIRRGLYRRFWDIVNNIGGWDLPQYIDKKIRVGGGPHIVDHQREIMPECVVKLLRTKYPNPKGIPYLGHKWQWS